MKRKWMERVVMLTRASDGVVLVNGERTAICNGWLALLLNRWIAVGGIEVGAYRITFRRGLTYGEEWSRGRLTKGKVGRGWGYIYAHVAEEHGRVPRGPLADVLREILGKSQSCVVRWKARKILF